MAELREAFIDSAGRQLDLMSRARCDANWVIAGSRLKSLANSAKRAEGQLDGVARGRFLEHRRTAENEVLAWTATLPDLARP